MSFQIVVEEGSGNSDANSYTSVGKADTFLEIEGPSSEWDALDVAGKGLMLARASRLIDRYSDFTGEPQTNTQALGWPRVHAFDYGVPSECDRSIPSGEVPESLQVATVLLAEALASGEFSSKTPGEGKVQSLSIPDLSVSLSGAAGPALGQSLPLPLRVVEYLKHTTYNAHGLRNR